MFRKLITLSVVLTTIAWTMGAAVFVPVTSAVTLSAGDLIQASGDAVYYYAADGKRYTFPTQSTYMSWYSNFDGLKTVTDDELAAIDLAGNVIMRAGTNLVKITTVPKVFAVAPNGMLYHIADATVAETLYGANWMTLVKDIPDGFWTNYTDSGEQLDGTTYPEGALVKADGSADINYVNADGTWSAIADMTAFDANMFNMDYVLTAPAAITGTAGTAVTAGVATLIDVSQGGGATVAPIGGNLTFSLSASSPVANSYVSKGVQNATFAKFNISGTASTINQIVLERKGLGYDADISTIRLFDGAVQVGNDQSLNTTTHQVTFKNLNWDVTSGDVLTVKVSTATTPGGTNDFFELVSVESDGTVAGLPVAGNALQFSALTVGQFDIDAQSSGSTVYPVSGETAIELGCWNFSTSSTEGFNVESLKLTNIGSASSGDALNFYLMQSSNKIAGSDVAAMASDGTVLFDLTSNPYFIDKSKVKKVCAYGDIASGITVTRTVRFQVAEAKDLSAIGDSSAGEVLATYSGGTSFTAQSAKTNSIAQGDATLSQSSSYAPVSGTLVKGVEGNKMAAYKLTAGSNEGVRLTKLKLTLDGTNVANTDFSNWSLYKIVDGEEVLVPVSGSVSGDYITFEDTTDGLLDVAKNENESLVVRGDVSTSAAGDETGAHVFLAANATTNTLARIQGLDSGDYITDGVTLSGVATGNAQTFGIDAYGTLVVSKYSSSPSAGNISKDSTGVHFTTLNLYATGEDMEIQELILTGASAGTLTDDVNTVYVTDEDGLQLGSTCSAFASDDCSFSFVFDVPKEENRQIKVYASTLASATAAATHIDFDTPGTNVTVVGDASGTDITATGTVVGSSLTITAPTITAYMGTTPVASSYVTNSSDLTVGTLLLQAGTAEDVKVTSIKISMDDASGITGASAASADFTGITLVDQDDPTIQYGITKNFTDGGVGEDYVTFSGMDNLIVDAGTTTRILVKMDVIGSADTGWQLGVLNPTTDIIATGSGSGYTLLAADINGSTTTAIESVAFDVVAVGTLKITAASGRATAAQFVAGTTGNSLMSYKLQTEYEEIDITELYIATTGASARADVSRVKLYLDGVQIGDAAGYSLNTGGDALVVLPAGTLVAPKNPEYSTLDIKVDFGVKASLTDGATLEIGLGDASGDDSAWTTQNGAVVSESYSMVAAGVSSGTTLTETDIDSLGTGGGTVVASYIQYLYDGLLVVALNPSSPSGVTTGGDDSELIRFDLTAVGDEITVDTLEFCYSGVGANATGGDTVLKSNDLNTTYGTITAAAFNTYWDTAGGGGDLVYIPLKTGVATNAQCFSFSDTDFSGATIGVVATNAIVEMTQMKISQGATNTYRLYGDTTGFTTNDSLKITIRENSTSAKAVTAAGVTWENNSATEVDSAFTKNLPVSGGTLTY